MNVSGHDLDEDRTGGWRSENGGCHHHPDERKRAAHRQRDNKCSPLVRRLEVVIVA